MTIPVPNAPGARPRAGLRVAKVPGVTLTKWRRIWAERFPRVRLEVVEVGEEQQRAVLDDGVVDLCFARLPLEVDGVHLIRLYDEVPVLVMPKDHALAARDELKLADLAGQRLVLGDGEASAIERVAWGSGVARMPHSIARSGSRKDVVHRPITDAEPTTVGLAWLVDNDNPLVEEFIGIVRGRTVNSSRTAAARASRQDGDAAPKPTPPRPKGSARGGRAARGRGRRRR